MIGILKAALKGDLLAHVGGIGTIDLVRIDPDDIPRRIQSLDRAGVNPGAYWALSLASLTDAPASWGSGPTVINIFRAYTLRLEGWRGFQATDETTSTWETLVESIADRLEVCSAAVAVQVDGATLGLQQVRRLGATVDVVRLGNNSRFHHAVITAQVETFRRIT